MTLVQPRSEQFYHWVVDLGRAVGVQRRRQGQLYVLPLGDLMNVPNTNSHQPAHSVHWVVVRLVVTEAGLTDNSGRVGGRAAD